MSATIRIGSTAECGFVFRSKAGLLVTQVVMSFELFHNGVSLGSFDQDGSSSLYSVTTGGPLGAELATALGLTRDQNAAGVGIISVEITPNDIGQWAVYANGITPVVDAATAKFKVIGQLD